MEKPGLMELTELKIETEMRNHKNVHSVYKPRFSKLLATVHLATRIVILSIFVLTVENGVLAFVFGCVLVSSFFSPFVFNAKSDTKIITGLG